MSQRDPFANDVLARPILAVAQRVRMDLSRGGFMDACVSPDASPETLAALRKVGEAALDRMISEAENSHPGSDA